MHKKINATSDSRPKILPMAEFALMLVENTLHQVKQLERELKTLSR